jgi:hypothetical protein
LQVTSKYCSYRELLSLLKRNERCYGGEEFALFSCCYVKQKTKNKNKKKNNKQTKKNVKSCFCGNLYFSGNLHYFVLLWWHLLLWWQTCDHFYGEWISNTHPCLERITSSSKIQRLKLHLPLKFND